MEERARELLAEIGHKNPSAETVAKAAGAIGSAMLRLMSIVFHQAYLRQHRENEGDLA